ncbi:GNAT family N-acetyltransferase [Lysobacter sp. BMK333-48F3]|uniref:GNAT family N-acetyltransferase n=1 Tax=Lysobacter sp. BMK333-48F3 TaxID=2867962 RepID=UPI001C8C0913|nr:GNAT family N-acetyltransferase [Lysobacter sp. BMK333-48F3]MBX9402152.1 GNAT family N-acetyltransferase [Lysobacter sp. BMK333-48F3]
MTSAPPEHDAVRIRRAGADDAAALALAGAATFLETFAGILDGPDIVAHCRNQHAVELYDGWLADPQCVAWLAETVHGAAPVGYALIAPPKLPLADLRADDLELKRIYLLSRFHGGGVGRELMRHAVEQARERGAGRLLLGVYAGNARALAFYARNGFGQVGERRFQVGANVYQDAILALELGA